MSVDWSQFRDGDKVRVTFEGTWRTSVPMPEVHCLAIGNGKLHSDGSLRSATSAELIERPFTPPPAGTLFRPGPSERVCIYVSHGPDGFRLVRNAYGRPGLTSTVVAAWDSESPEWLASIEVLDI
jgi:hypothetical protein